MGDRRRESRRRGDGGPGVGVGGGSVTILGDYRDPLKEARAVVEKLSVEHLALTPSGEGRDGRDEPGRRWSKRRSVVGQAVEQLGRSDRCAEPRRDIPPALGAGEMVSLALHLSGGAPSTSPRCLLEGKLCCVARLQLQVQREACLSPVLYLAVTASTGAHLR